AIKYLTEALQSTNELELEDTLEKIIDAVEKQPLSSNMIERSVVEVAVQECRQSVDETILLMTNHPTPNLFGTARDKAELYRERYTILHQRTHRHELFTPPVIGSQPDESGSKFQLKTIETLLGSTTKIGDVIVLGMITQLKEFHSGLYTEACFVLAEGWFEDQVFHVNAFGFPPTEPSSTTRAYYGNINFFGGPSNTSVKTSTKLKQLEDENKDAMFVFISDVWLDQAEVLEKLHTMFSGYSPAPPTCFILCGNFSSAPYGKNQVQALKVYWAYDYTLRVYPVPDVLVIADKYDPFTVTNTECLCINPVSL
ncbi:DNA polymerase epsilon subunit 2, partial [Sciurus carolinensis]|nr:DNA polymerase epsilon subunit 2 [Sciurus carolinensis]